mmetsp:Transcript_59639/g.193114  ORF Transcript_59639/g.193114 Transcript_59639/m.193114 type:complete len:225 (+) Transcript_59639:1411-2085(+)
MPEIHLVVRRVQRLEQGAARGGHLVRLHPRLRVHQCVPAMRCADLCATHHVPLPHACILHAHHAPHAVACRQPWFASRPHARATTGLAGAARGGARAVLHRTGPVRVLQQLVERLVVLRPDVHEPVERGHRRGVVACCVVPILRERLGEGWLVTGWRADLFFEFGGTSRGVCILQLARPDSFATLSHLPIPSTPRHATHYKYQCEAHSSHSQGNCNYAPLAQHD